MDREEATKKAATVKDLKFDVDAEEKKDETKNEEEKKEDEKKDEEKKE